MYTRTIVGRPYDAGSGTILTLGNPERQILSPVCDCTSVRPLLSLSVGPVCSGNTRRSHSDSIAKYRSQTWFPAATPVQVSRSARREVYLPVEYTRHLCSGDPQPGSSLWNIHLDFDVHVQSMNTRRLRTKMNIFKHDILHLINLGVQNKR